MGFAGFVASGVTPAVAGALRGRNMGRQQAEEQRRYDTEQARIASQTKWAQQQALEQAQRQSMLDALAREAQAAAMKDRAEGNAIRRMEAMRTPPSQESYQTFVGPKGPGVYGVTEGQDPRYLGGVVQEPTNGGGPGTGEGVSDLPPRGARLVNDPESGMKVWVHPAFPGKKWPAGTKMDTPTAANADIAANERSLEVVRAALAAVRTNPDAVGGWDQWLLPTSVQGVIDPGGQKSRNDIADIGSLQIKDRSGATVPQGELKRLGFVPDVKDPPEVVKDKLDRLARWIVRENEILRQQYPQARGFSPAATSPAEGTTDAQSRFEAWKAKQGRP